MLTNLLLVGIGGFFGSAGRYLLSMWVMEMAAQSRFPWPTFAVNLVGCLIIGVLAGLVEKQVLLNQEARLFLLTGLIGGFTTFSAFGLETVTLLRRGELMVAGVYVGASVVLGMFAVWLGMRMLALAVR